MIKSLKSIPEQIITKDLSKLWKTHEGFTNNKQEWIFRGLKDVKYGLKTSLERAIEEYGIDKNKSLSFEGGLLRKFKREVGEHLKQPPKEEEYMEWFALMQHHGAPTRLMEWTYSFLIAVYFAVAGSPKDSVVWAINSKGLTESLKEKKVDTTNFKHSFVEKKNTFVCPMNIHRFNERLALQQGAFVLPADVTKSFQKNLLDTFRDQKSLNKNIRKYVIKKEISIEITKSLIRMNLTSATLFPDLDGFSQSLKEWLAFKDEERILKPEDGYGVTQK